MTLDLLWFWLRREEEEEEEAEEAEFLLFLEAWFGDGDAL